MNTYAFTSHHPRQQHQLALRRADVTFCPVNALVERLSGHPMALARCIDGDAKPPSDRLTAPTALPVQSPLRQIPIALTSRVRPAVSSLEDCPTPAV